MLRSIHAAEMSLTYPDMVHSLLRSGGLDVLSGHELQAKCSLSMLWNILALHLNSERVTYLTDDMD